MHSKPKPSPTIYKRSEHLISRREIDNDALRVMQRLVGAGFRAYLVGGGVRDLLLGKTPKDFDIATSAHPHQIKQQFRNCRIIGRRFKLAHVYFPDGKIIEVATFRDQNDEESEGMIQRDNYFGDERTDALRRDLTINALFYDSSNFTILDYVGGLEDLRNKIVRVIGEPGRRFEEDPVRMLRVVRHAVRSGFAIEPSCLDSILENHSLITQCPDVRIFEELKKDLNSGYAYAILSKLQQTGLLQHLLPKIDQKVISDLGFSEAFRRIDSETDKDTLTSVLVVLMLGAAKLSCSLESISELKSNTEMQAWLSTAFSKLAVPKREKERVMQALLTLRKALKNIEREKTLNELSTRSSFHDALKICYCLDPSNEIYSLLSSYKGRPVRLSNKPGFRKTR